MRRVLGPHLDAMNSEVWSGMDGWLIGKILWFVEYLLFTKTLPQTSIFIIFDVSFSVFLIAEFTWGWRTCGFKLGYIYRDVAQRRDSKGFWYVDCFSSQVQQSWGWTPQKGEWNPILTVDEPNKCWNTNEFLRLSQQHGIWYLYIYNIYIYLQDSGGCCSYIVVI